MMSQRGCPEWCVHTKHEALCYSHKYSHWRVFGDDQIFTRNSQQEEEESTASSWSGVTVDFHFSPTSATILIIFFVFPVQHEAFFLNFCWFASVRVLVWCKHIIKTPPETRLFSVPNFLQRDIEVKSSFHTCTAPLLNFSRYHQRLMHKNVLDLTLTTL